mgnify:CR=1 FL=1
MKAFYYPSVRWISGGIWASTIALTATTMAQDPTPDSFFTEQVMPVLQENCIGCHGPEKQKSGLRLDSLAQLFVKSAVIPGDTESSRMIQAVHYEEADLQMPPDGKLPDEAIAILEKWVNDGTPWPGTTVEAAQADAKAIVAATIVDQPKYWAFRAPEMPAVPVAADPAWSENPIDGFVFKGLTEKKLTPSPEADRRTLIRRLYLDVLGLAPAPEEVEAFIKDTDANAYEKLVDHVLASPHYGERWARHWLDVAGFAETDGFETNIPRPNAWRYRDYVIQAINDDIPYTQFIKEQIAGDAMGADMATGYLVAGPWDRVKSPDIVLTKNQRDGELHDMVNRTSAAFLGLTAGCAKCHDHKFDPISQRDYFQLRAIFSGVQHGEREVRPADYDERVAKAEVVQQQIQAIDGELATFRPQANTQLTCIDDDGPLFQLEGAPSVSLLRRPLGRAFVDKDENSPGEGYLYWEGRENTDLFSWNLSATGRHQIWLSWIAGEDRSESVAFVLDQDGDLATTEDQTTLATVNTHKRAAQEDDVLKGWEWSGFYDGGIHTLQPTARILLRPLNEGRIVGSDLVAIQPLAEEAAAPAMPVLRPQLRAAVTARLNEENFAPVEATALRITVQGTNNGNDVCIDELEVYSAEETTTNVALASLGATPSASSDYAENTKHKTIHLNDGKLGNDYSWIPGEKGEAWAQVDFATAQTINRVVWARDRKGGFDDRLATQYYIDAMTPDGTWKRVASSLDRAPFGQRVSAIAEFATVGLESSERKRLNAIAAQKPALDKEHKELLAFDRIYGGRFETAEPTNFLYRGDPMEERAPVNPGGIAQVGHALQLASDTPEQQRRVAFANWVADADNPLTARVMVNRIWHYHFGRGIVDTPSDFGAMGSRPSNPELLDWLALTFIQDGWKPKSVHRRILLSQTYRQSSTPREDAMAIDAGTFSLWRFPPRRLEAEPIRDTVLQASGVLDMAMGGPGYEVFKPNSNYVRVYDPKVEFGPAEWRRMIYQMKPRMEQDETFGIFDCPDGAQNQPKRNASTTPLQALNMLNSPFMNQQAKLFAERLAEAADNPAAQAERAFQLAYARKPGPEEKEASAAFITEHGLDLFCRAIYNTNEFLYLN